MTTLQTAKVRISSVEFQFRMLALAVLMLIVSAMTALGHAQTFSVLYNFDTGFSGNGAGPEAGLSMDVAGNLYGTASTGGPQLAGGVFKLSHRGSGWIYTPLYLFTGGGDGGRPVSRVIFGPNGSLYGTTADGGASNIGTVFNLQPPPGICKSVRCSWRETVLHSFALDDNGASPEGDLVFDQAGNLYGTLFNGGHNNGAAYELSPSSNGWTESVLYLFPGNGGSSSPRPSSGLVFDNAGNLYGTTQPETTGGSVYQLSPSQSGWTATTLYVPQGGNEGTNPVGGVIVDDAGNLYGTTYEGGALGGGTVFELTPSNGSWIPTVLYSFSGSNGGPYASLT
ncbi:MAG: choice-of-anchor tandem repeat GloVer-containing protein, partial [Candidatus Korobacteraceae bacterium]